jgi:hypothetical protein
MCERLRWTSELVEESAFMDGPARLAKRLLILASLHGRAVRIGRLELGRTQIVIRNTDALRAMIAEGAKI